MKKICQCLAVLITCLLVIPVSNIKAEPKTITIEITLGDPVPIVDGIKQSPSDIAPYILKQRLMVAPRLLVEMLKLKGEYDTQDKILTLVDSKTSLKLKYNSQTAIINGKETPIDVSFDIKNSRSVLPLRLVAETFGATVSWDPTIHKATIVYEIPEETFMNRKTVKLDCDTTPPIIEIYSPIDNSETSENKIQVKGKMSDPESGIQSLNVIGNVANIQELDGMFSFDWNLTKSINTVDIVVTNGSEQKTTKTLTVFKKGVLDITPPFINITYPEDNSETKETQLSVRGTIYDQESGVEAIKVIGNTANIIELNGSLSFDWILKEDKNTVDVEATNGAGLKTTKRLTVYKRPVDIVGPKTVIELWIGKKTGSIDGISWVLDVPPQILKGRTFVPIRFIAEAFRFKVVYEATDQSITITGGTTMVYLQINNNEATVTLVEDGKPKIKFVMLETPPIIQKGRTLVPVRFIAEAFGANVDWNSKESKITITMKK